MTLPLAKNSSRTLDLVFPGAERHLTNAIATQLSDVFESTRAHVLAELQDKVGRRVGFVRKLVHRMKPGAALYQEDRLLTRFFTSRQLECVPTGAPATTGMSEPVSRTETTDVHRGGRRGQNDVHPAGNVKHVCHAHAV